MKDILCPFIALTFVKMHCYSLYNSYLLYDGHRYVSESSKRSSYGLI